MKPLIPHRKSDVCSSCARARARVCAFCLKPRFYLENFTWAVSYNASMQLQPHISARRLISRAFMFLDSYRAHFNLHSQTVRNLIDSLLRIRALYFRERRVRIGFNVNDFAAAESFFIPRVRRNRSIPTRTPNGSNFQRKSRPTFHPNCLPQFRNR